MTPKEKAAYLVVKYMSKVVSNNVAKECALVAADEIMIIMNEEYFSDALKIEYWKQVKEEIEKLCNK